MNFKEQIEQKYNWESDILTSNYIIVAVLTENNKEHAEAIVSTDPLARTRTYLMSIKPEELLECENILPPGVTAFQIWPKNKWNNAVHHNVFNNDLTPGEQ